MGSIGLKLLILPCLVLFLFPHFTSAQVTSIEITPSYPKPGDMLSIKLRSTPIEKVDVIISYAGALNVSDNEFYLTMENMEIPENIETVQVEAINVSLLRVTSIITGIPITQTAMGEDGRAKITQNHISSGVYWMQLSGIPTVGVEQVFFTVSAQSSIITDDNGEYTTKYNTVGFPPGEIIVKAGSFIKKILLRNNTTPEPSPQPTPRNLIIEPHNIPESFQLNNEIMLYYRITNEGETLTGLIVQSRVDDELILQKEISQIPGYDTYIYTISWTPNQSGSHIFQVVIDPHNTVHETNESDNIAEVSVDVKDPRNNSLVIISTVLLVVIIIGFYTSTRRKRITRSETRYSDHFLKQATACIMRAQACVMDKNK